MTEVTVLYFATYREQAGVSTERMSVTGDRVNLGELMRKICLEHPNISRESNKIVAAVNEEYQDHDHILNNGDTVALIPPVSGGCQTY
ncbi:MAG: molybdopterin converting factor subunit 1 [Chloroflexota bacterium]|nr:molybdopterin converting factor subunit 1 [Chloroflexota bacterium]